MEKIKQQFGTAVVDGRERNYCNITVEVESGEGINKFSLNEQFKLIVESFWLYIKAQEEAKINRSLLEPDSTMDFDGSALKKGWF
uniref:hypothetical protein n=1 Tax=Acetatifactor sp. TaxID=1872090 RepID=UPI0040568417